MLLKQVIIPCVTETLQELKEEIKTFQYHQLTRASVTELRAAASRKTPCKISWQTFYFLCLQKCWQFKISCQNLTQGHALQKYRGPSWQILSQSTEIKGNAEIILENLRCFYTPHLQSFDLKTNIYIYTYPQIRSHFDVIFPVMVRQLWAIWFWGLTYFGRCQRLFLVVGKPHIL